MTGRHDSGSGEHGGGLQRLPVWLFIALLAWLPFPLGSAISWGAGLFGILIAICWMAWVLTRQNLKMFWPRPKIAWISLLLFGGVLAWALVQALVPMPAQLAHPLWAMSASILGNDSRNLLSIDPWRTESEVLKLAAEGLTCWLAYCLARDARQAALLHNAIAAIGVAYVLYAFGLLFAQTSQAQILYHLPFSYSVVTGPFMLHNSFATFSGLAVLPAVTRLFQDAGREIIGDRGIRRLLLSFSGFAFGRGAVWIAATLILVLGIVASSSRGGLFSTLAAILAMAAISLFLPRQSLRSLWPVASIGVLLLGLLLFALFHSENLSGRFSQLLDAGNADNVRLALWTAARRMVASSPWTGLGLGTFADAYPLYATQFLPFVMDKAHCDYLELAAGLGLPAALACLTAIGLLAALCIQGIFVRKRDRIFPLVGFAATMLVAIHSAFDFSLQIPAVAALYATLLGIGLAQSQRSKAA